MTIKTENWLGEYTSTIGTGDVILGGAIDGFADFSNIGDDVDVYYTIMDALDKETGIGTITGGKLVRKEIHATLVSGVYVKNGSAINLSGDAQVYGTANAKFLADVYAFMAIAEGNTQLLLELQQLQINGHALTGSFNLTAADVGARPDNWTPTADDVGSYSKAASDNRYVATAKVEGSTNPDYKIMVTDGPRDKELVQKIEQADTTLQNNIDDAKQTLQQNIDNVAVTFIGPNPPHNPPEGKKWYDTNSGRSYIYLNDGDTLQWVEESPQGNGLVDTSPLLIAMANNNFGPLCFRNILINGDFRVNQRSYDGNFANLAEGKYGYDRWKKVGANLVQVVESVNFKKGAAYVLSGTNVPTTKMIAPASGDWTITVPSNASNIQLELGDNPTPFENRPYGLELQLCRRYYRGFTVYHGLNHDGAWVTLNLQFLQDMAKIKNVATGKIYNGASGSTIKETGTWALSSLDQGSGVAYANITGGANAPNVAGWVAVSILAFDAEL